MPISILGGADLIRVAGTRTPEGAVPSRGCWLGSASDYLGMTAQVSGLRIDIETVLGIERDAAGEP